MPPTLTAPTAPAIITAPPTDVVGNIAWQKEQRRAGKHQHLGRVWCIVFEAARGAAVPAKDLASRVGVRFDFYGRELPIAQTLDHSTLLLLAPITRTDGSVGLPDIPDPNWKPPIPKPSEISGGKRTDLKKAMMNRPEAPKVAQPLKERARGVHRESGCLVFGPVAQVLIRPEGFAEGWIASCFADPDTGTQMELLVDPKTGAAHFFGGRFEISRFG